MQKCEEIFPHLKWAGYIAPEGNPCKGERPASYIILVANPRINKNFQHDFGAAAQNIMLVAHSIGIGSCWLSAIDRDQIRKVLNVPFEYEIDTLIALGYPKEKPMIEEAKDSIKYYKDSKGRLHVPKKSLKKIIHTNKW
jgi:nitroreductase